MASMLGSESITSPVGFFSFVAFLTLSGAARSYGALLHWPSTQRRFGWLLYWGRRWFPASRLGTFCSGLTAVWLGLLMLAQGLEWNLEAYGDYIMTAFIVWMLIMVAVGIRDYFLHVDREGQKAADAEAETSDERRSRRRSRKR